ncbi:cyclic nucleotide-binding domain-containing protein [Terasakiella pusilla]|uniref:cyclic nucleotide-binding domain-containing protein n=1 Tax=Terasakiella pusilla TaxID=64973 RepID=UPI003AA7D4A0
MSNQALQYVHFKPKSVLFKEGEKPDFAYIIKKGNVRISKRGPSGKKISIAKAGQGNIVGEMAIISDSPRSATVVAIDTVEAIAINKTSFDTKLKSADPFLHSLISTVIKRLRKTSDHTVALYDKVREQEKNNLITVQPSKKKEVTKEGISRVNLLLADPNRQTRHGLRSGLFSHGFRDICDTSTYQQITEQTRHKNFDLIILDAAFGMYELTTLIQEIRHAKSSKNPFATILVITEKHQTELHDPLRHSGCDEILTKPLSMMDIIGFIDNMIQNNARTFVVTRDYAGPDRPNYKDHTAQDAPRFRPPNSLVAKMVNRVDCKVVDEAIQKASLQFNEMKIERHLVQIDWLLKRLGSTDCPPHDIHYLFDQIEQAINDLILRTQASRFDEARKICHKLKQALSSPCLQEITSLYQLLLQCFPQNTTPHVISTSILPPHSTASLS